MPQDQNRIKLTAMKKKIQQYIQGNVFLSSITEGLMIISVPMIVICIVLMAPALVSYLFDTFFKLLTL